MESVIFQILNFSCILARNGQILNTIGSNQKSISVCKKSHNTKCSFFTLSHKNLDKCNIKPSVVLSVKCHKLPLIEICCNAQVYWKALISTEWRPHLKQLCTPALSLEFWRLMDEERLSREQLRSLYSIWTEAKWTKSKCSHWERSGVDFFLLQNSSKRRGLVNQLHLLQALGPLGGNTHTRAHTCMPTHVYTPPYARINTSTGREQTAENTSRHTDPEVGGNMPVWLVSLSGGI